MTLADDRRIVALAGLSWENISPHAWANHFNPAYVSKLLDVVEAAQALHAAWEIPGYESLASVKETEGAEALLLQALAALGKPC